MGCMWGFVGWGSGLRRAVIDWVTRWIGRGVGAFSLVEVLGLSRKGVRPFSTKVNGHGLFGEMGLSQSIRGRNG